MTLRGEKRNGSRLLTCEQPCQLIVSRICNERRIAQRDTFGHIRDRFLDEYEGRNDRALRPKTRHEYGRLLRTEFKEWEQRPISDIEARDVNEAKSRLKRTRGGRERPMLKSGDPRKILATLMASRDPQYREIAHLVIETNGRRVPSVVREIRRNMPPC